MNVPSCHELFEDSGCVHTLSDVFGDTDKFWIHPDAFCSLRKMVENSADLMGWFWNVLRPISKIFEASCGGLGALEANRER